MKRINILLVCLMLGMSFMSYAQQGQGRGNMQNVDPATRAKNTVERLTEQLQLTKTQQDSVHKQALAQATEEKAIFAKATEGGDREQVRTQMQAVREKYSSKIKTYLNDAQLKKYNELQEQWSQRRPRGNQ